MLLFKKFRIDLLFFTLVTVILVATLCLAGAISYRISSEELAGSASRYQQDLLGELNKQVYAQLHALELMSVSAGRTVELMLTSAALTSGDAYEQTQREQDLVYSLASYVYGNNILDSIHLYMERPFPTGELHSVQLFSFSQLADEAFYPWADERAYFWIPEHTIASSTGPRPVISFARKIYTARSYSSLLVFNIKTSEIVKLVSSGKADANRLLLGPAGNVMASIGDAERYASLVDAERINSQPSGNLRVPDANLFLVWSRSDGGWTLLEMTPWKQIVQGSNRLASALVGAGIAASLICCAIAFYLSRQFVRPIRRLVWAMDAFPDPAACDNLPRDYTNEFGVLFSGYANQVARNRELLISLDAQYKQLQEAELQALQAMINPHFLYNTLDQINWMAIEAGQEKISESLSLVARMFDIGLSGGRTLVPLENEMLHIQYYLKIQKIHWEDRISYDIRMEEGLEKLLVPRFILQPFIENAIVHGFHGREGGRITVDAQRSGEDLTIVIEDDGVGIDPNWETKKRPGGGYGMRNVVTRISTLHGKPYGVTVTARPEGGTRLVVRLPVREEA